MQEWEKEGGGRKDASVPRSLHAWSAVGLFGLVLLDGQTAVLLAEFLDGEGGLADTGVGRLVVLVDVVEDDLCLFGECGFDVFHLLDCV